MDLTARDPSKVPRCILSGTAGVSGAGARTRNPEPEAKDLVLGQYLNEAQAEWELAAEILSDPELAEGESKDLCFEPLAGVREATPGVSRQPKS